MPSKEIKKAGLTDTPKGDKGPTKKQKTTHLAMLKRFGETNLHPLANEPLGRGLKTEDPPEGINELFNTLFSTSDTSELRETAERILELLNLDGSETDTMILSKLFQFGLLDGGSQIPEERKETLMRAFDKLKDGL